MDRRLRELERQAIQGDTHALHKLLIRLHSLGDFNLADLSLAARQSMAVALMRTMNEGEKTRAIELSEANFIPGHDSLTECPNHPDCDATPDGFIYSYLAWESHYCFVNDDGDPPTVSHNSNWENILTTHLHCQQCQTTWRITESLDWA